VPALRWLTVAKGGGGLSLTYAVICQRENLDSGAHGLLHSLGRRPGYSRCIASTAARPLDQHVFCFFGLLEQIHIGRGAQF